jgi:GMP synthase (glutamine-hydrolysing)
LPAKFPAQASHFQSVFELPAGAVLLASSEADPHHAFRVGPHTWGVQYHPEHSKAHQEVSLENLRETLTKCEQDVDALLVGLTDTPEARTTLLFFAQYANSI